MKLDTIFSRILATILILAGVFLAFLFLLPTAAHAATYDGEIEVLGGGGGGGVVSGSAGGGGGGGEYRRCIETLSVQSYTVTVGAGASEDAASTSETDSSFSGTGISMTADGGNSTGTATAGSAGTGGSSTNCDTAVVNYDGGSAGGGVTQDFGGGAGGGAGYGGKGGNGVAAVNGRGGGGGEGGSESAAGNDASAASGGTGGGGGDGGAGGTGDVNGNPGSAGTPATYHIVGGGGGGGSGGSTNRVGGACGAPGAGSGGGEATGAGAGCRGEVRIIYVDAEVDATGGTQTTSGIYRIHTFTSSGTFQVTALNTVAPTVTTSAASGISSFAAVLNGDITATGGANSTVRGFAWGKTSTLTGGDTATTTESGSFGVASFTGSVGGLVAGQTYYFRAYATNSAGTGYGSITSFTASAADTTASRKLRLFEGSRVILLEGGRIILHQK